MNMEEMLFRRYLSILQFASFLFIFVGFSYGSSYLEKEHGVIYASKCEVCKYLAIEIQGRLEETGKTKDVIRTGYNFMDDRGMKEKKYVQSEVRLVETLENICERILEYNIHKERKDSTRFARGMSETFQALHGLVDRGVKVDLGIPVDLWDKPSAEVTHLKMQCETLLEKHEDDINEWYFKHQDIPLMRYLCTERALKNTKDDCLHEVLASDKSENVDEDEPFDKTKQDNEKSEL